MDVPVQPGGPPLGNPPRNVRRGASGWAVLLACMMGCDSPGEQALHQGLRIQHGDAPGDPVALFSRAIALDPGVGRYHEVRAMAYEARCDWGRARDDYTRAIALAPRAWLYFARGMTFCHLGDPDAALRDVSTAITLQPDNWQFYDGQALAALLRGRPEAALRAVDTAVGHAAAASYRYDRGVILARMGRQQDAVAQFARVVQQEDGHGTTVYHDGLREAARATALSPADVWGGGEHRCDNVSPGR